MYRFRIIRARGVLAAGLFAVLSSSCIPYAVGTTAETAPRGTRQRTLTTSVLPPVKLLDSVPGLSTLTFDGEVRRGIDSVSDFGIRIVNASGFVMNYKRLLTRRDEPALISMMAGGGLVNMGSHAYFEATLITSPRTRRAGAPVESRFVPYGGLRAMQVLPLSEEAVRDRTTLGGFVGMRIGTTTLGVSPEVGVFYDPSALGVRDDPIVIVPSISVHGDVLIELIQQIPRRPRF